MKNYLLIIMILFIQLIGCKSKEESKTVVKGHIEGVTTSKLYLNIYTKDSILRDSANVVNGDFTFNLNINDISAARLVTKDKSKKIFVKESNFYFPALQLLFFIEPKKTVTINGNYSEWPITNIEGGKNNILLSQYYLSNKENLLNSRKTMRKMWDFKNRGDSVGFSKKEKEFLDYKVLNKQNLEKIVSENPNSLLAAFYTLEKLPFINNEQELEKTYLKFDDSISDHYYGERIHERLLDLKGAAIGTIVKEFSVTGKDSIVDIEAFRGKYVLLDFWGSWCAPCRESHPHLKKLYEKYKDNGFEIIGIANEKSEEPRKSWLKAIESDALPWVNILNNEAIEKDNSDLITLFAIKSYPTKILIDPNGKIIAKPNNITELDSIIKSRMSKK